MNAPLPSTVKFDIQGLALAIGHNHAADSFRLSLSPAHWDILASYMQPFALMQGQVLIEQGGTDRTLYFIETGSLSVHYQDQKARVRLAILGPGSVVGEGSFFSHVPRNATVQAASHSKLWSLTSLRFSDLSSRQPGLALELVMAMGAVVSKRLFNRPRRVAVT